MLVAAGPVTSLPSQKVGGGHGSNAVAVRKECSGTRNHRLPFGQAFTNLGLTLSNQADDGPCSTADSGIAGAQRRPIWIVARPNAPARNRGSLSTKIVRARSKSLPTASAAGCRRS